MKKAVLFSAALLLCGCQTEYHPYDMRISGERGVNAKNIALIERDCAGKDRIRFAVISDTQRWYDETSDEVDFINRLDGIDFVLHTGDIADYGMRVEFERQRDILNRLTVPYVCVIGNHDCLATGEIAFRKIFGEYDYSFRAGDVRFVCVNMNALEFDHTVPIPNFSFLSSEIDANASSPQKTVVVMHAAPDSEQADKNTVGFFEQEINRFPNLQFCVHGHGHTFRVKDIFDDGVVYYECDCAKNRNFLIFTIDNGGYSYERVEY